MTIPSRPRPEQATRFATDPPSAVDADDADVLHLTAEEEASYGPGCWKVLVVDDEPEVHRVTALSLDGFRFRDRPLQLIDVRSAAEAIRTLDQESDIAVVLLDVVMESEAAGFDVIQHIRDTLDNRVIRIILRTGQPGQAPAREVIRRYEIDDYHSKAELTADRMFIAMHTSLAMYEHLQARRERERQLERAYADIEQLVFIASHDLQEPLRSVTALGQRLLSTNREQLDADGRLCLDYLLTAVTRMSGMVLGLRQYAQLGRPEPLQAVDMNALFDACCKDFQSRISAHGAQVTRDDLPPTHGQPDKLKLLLHHLLGNALRYHHPQRTPQILLTSRADPRGVVYTLQDNGVGIPPEHRASVFKVFYRLAPGTAPGEDTPGTGIGLAHCRKIIDQHGGAIWIETAPAAGVSVCFSVAGDAP